MKTIAAVIAIGMGAEVTVIDRSIDVLRRISDQFGARVQTVFSTRDAIAGLVKEAGCLSCMHCGWSKCS